MISSELDARFSSRSIDKDRYRTWSGDGINVKLVGNTDEAGMNLTLTASQGEPDARTDEKITEALIEELTRHFTSTFPELEQVSVTHKNGELIFSGNIAGSDGGVIVTWPTSPLVDDGLESAFVDAMIGDLLDSYES